jgi:tetratricopeptide (TPR) repeat protein
VNLTLLFLTAALAAPAPGTVPQVRTQTERDSGAPVSAVAPESTSPVVVQAEAQARLQAMEARYRSAIALAPEVASYHVDLAEVLDRRGRTAEASAAYAEGLRLDPASSRTRALYGQFLARHGDLGGAAEHLREAVKRDPSSPSYAEALADVYGRQGRWEDAADALGHAVELSPADSGYRRALRNARAQAGMDVDAPVTRASEDSSPPLLLRIIELTMGSILAIAGVALVYPIISGVLLAVRTGISALSPSRA